MLALLNMDVYNACTHEDGGTSCILDWIPFNADTCQGGLGTGGVCMLFLAPCTSAAAIGRP
jgi:hypothetical protein